jgi:hypothetical protein
LLENQPKLIKNNKKALDAKVNINYLFFIESSIINLKIHLIKPNLFILNIYKKSR